jgi:hypothetical protein
MHMGRLVRLMAVKIQAVWPHHQDGWHAFQYLTVVRRIPASPGRSVVNPLPGAAVGAETRQVPLSSILRDKGGSIAQKAGFGTTGRAKVRDGGYAGKWPARSLYLTSTPGYGPYPGGR